MPPVKVCQKLLAASIVSASIAASSVCLAARPTIEIVNPRRRTDFASIQLAVTAAARSKAGVYLIEIRPGRYHESITVPKMAGQVLLDGMGKSPSSVWIGAGKGKRTLTVHAGNFLARNLTVDNTAGPTAGPQNAVYIDGRHQIFDHVVIKGWQDTLAIWNGCTSYFTHCQIWGSVDFIYSGGTALFSNCTILQRRDTGGVNCAPSTPKNVAYGFIFRHCLISKLPGVRAASSTLMRPWRAYGMAAYIDCTMDNHITEGGGSRWDGREHTCRALEFGSVTPAGKLINLSRRAPWVKRISAAQSRHYTLSHIFPHWNPPAMLKFLGR